MVKKMAVGYNRPGYSWGESIKNYKKTRQFKFVKDGSGHLAGEVWADKKGIDPSSPQRKYSKNSPSFDEGVWNSKQRRKVIANMTGKYQPLYPSIINQT